MSEQNTETTPSDARRDSIMAKSMYDSAVDHIKTTEQEQARLIEEDGTDFYKGPVALGSKVLRNGVVELSKKHVSNNLLEYQQAAKEEAEAAGHTIKVATEISPTQTELPQK